MRIRRYHGPADDAGIPADIGEAREVEALCMLAAAGVRGTELGLEYLEREAARNKRRRDRVRST